ncbi:MAG: fibronectin type III domain-containing protein, partial [Bacteroidales bacterium]|nr:fibronectin type III domain-containing protein [Bacteroidales bacterium]
MKKHLSMLMLIAALIVPWASRAQDACTPISTFPVTYGFEASEGFTTTVTAAAACTTNVFGPCWRNEATSGTATSANRIWHIYGGTSATYIHTGAHSLMLPDKGSSSALHTTMLVFPAMDFTSPNGYVVSFWIQRNGTGTSTPEGFKIYASDTDTIGPNAVELGHYSRHRTMAYPVIESASGWYQYETLPITMTGTVYIIFEGQSYYSSSTYIDDVVITEAPSCIKVAGLTDIPALTTTTSITLSWTDTLNNNATYNLYSITATDTTLIASGISDTTYTVTNLEHSSEYTFVVVTDCGSGDTSLFSYPYSCRTLCAPLTEFPYIEDFESYGTGSSYSINPCWPKGTSSTTAYPYPYSTAAINGDRGLYFYGYYPSSSSSTRIYSWAALPPIDDGYNMSDLMVTFNVKRYTTTTNYYTTLLYVGVADSVNALSDTAALASQVTWIDTVDLFNALSGSIHNIEVSFAEYEGDGKYVVLYAPVPPLVGTSTYAYNYVYVDDVVLRIIPTCFWPTDVVLDSVATDEATISWTPDSRTTNPSSWSVEYGPEGFTPGNGTTETVYDTTIVITGLTPNTLYDVYVSAECSGDISDPAFFSFRTLCTALDSLPFFEDFEQAPTNTASTEFGVPCYGHINNGTQYFGYPILSSTSTYNHTVGGTKGLYWYGSTTATTYGDYYYLVLPAVDADIYPMNTLQVRFWAKSSSTSYDVNLQVGVMTNPTDITTFQMMENVHVGGNTTWEEYTVVMGNYTGEGQYIAIRGMRPSSTWYAYMDDITIETMPSCPPIVGIEANTTVGSALLTWDFQSGYDAPAAYVVTYDSIGGTNPVTVNVTTNSATLSGLVAGTDYKAYVKADCGTDGFGGMDSIEFSTGNFGCAQVDTSNADTVIFTNATSGISGCLANSSWGNTAYQTIYTAAELTAAGLTAGPISGIDLGFTSSTYAKEFTIFMGNTSTTSISNATFEAPQTQVYGPAPHPSGTSGWQHYEFSEPFVWDGVSSILLTTFMNQPTGTSQTSSSGLTGYYVSAASTTRYRYRDSQQWTVNNLTEGTGASTYTYRAAIHFYSFGCLTPATCAAPSVVISDVDTTSVTISWVPGYDETSWDVSYRVVGDSAWIYDNTVNTTSHTVANLLPATNYEFRVSFVCSENTEYSDEVRATTPCVPATLPYMENFDSISTHTSTSVYGVMPLCWEYTLTGTSTYTTGSYVPGAYYSPAHAASGNYSLRLAGVGIYELPEMPMPLENLRISFSDTITSASYGLVVGVMENGMFLPIDTADLAINTRNEIEVLLNTYHGTSRTIALKNYYTTSTSTYTSYHYIDDIVVDLIPDCNHVEDLTVSDLTDASLTLSWVPVAGESAWIVAYDSTSFVTNDTVVAITGLSPNTQYTFEVYSLCSTGDTSEAETVTITTPCAPMALPYTEDFETYGSGAAQPISNCWVKNVFGTTTQYPYPYATNAITGQRSLYFYAYRPSSASTTPYSCYAALPMFQDSINRLMISFQVRRYSNTTNYYTTRLVVGVMDNPNDISTFFPMDTIDLFEAEALSVHGYEFHFNNYTGNGKYIAIYDEVPPLYGNGTYTYSYAYVDDVMVDTIPSCMRPNNVTINNIATNGATVHWNHGVDITDFEVEYGLHGFSHGTGTTVTVTGDSIDLTGLLSGSQYDVYVRAICSATDQSHWSFSQSFYTECDVFSVPFFEDFENYGSGSTMTIHPCWTKGTNNTTAYPYPYSTNAITGERSLYFYAYHPSTTTSTAYYSYVALPEFNVSVDSLELSFKMRRYATSGNYYTSRVLVGVMTNPNDISTFVAVDTIDLHDEALGSVHEISVELSSYSGTGKYIAIYDEVPPLYGTSTYTYSYTYIDDISVNMMSPCGRPSELQAIAVTGNSITLEWLDTVGSSQWEIEYGPTGFELGTGTTVTATSNPYTITGLSSSTVYDIYVRSYCLSGMLGGTNNGVFSCSTSQVPGTVPYYYNFEDAAEWTNWQSVSNNVVGWYRGTAEAAQGTYGLYVSADSGATWNSLHATITNAAVYRDIDFGSTPSSFEMTFLAKSAGVNDGNFEGINVMLVDPSLPVEASSTSLTSPWGPFNTVHVVRDTNWQEYTLLFDNVSGVKRVVFNWYTSTTSSHPVWEGAGAIDSIVINEQSCIRPLDTRVTNVGSDFVSLAWNGPDTATYIVRLREFGDTVNIDNVATTNSLTVTGLSSQTNYYVWVYRMCDTNNYSYSAPRIEFATTCLPMVASDTVYEDFNSIAGTSYNTAGNLPNCWEGYSNGTSDAYWPHVTDGSTYSYSVSGNSVTLTSGSGTTYGNTKILRLPKFAEPINTLTMNYWYCTESNTIGTLYVGYMTGFDYENDFVPIATRPASSASYHSGDGVQTAGHGVFDTISFDSVPANALFIAFKWYQDGTFYSVCIDNVEVISSVSCPAPVATVASSDFQSANINVTGTGIEYELVYGTDVAAMNDTLVSTTGLFSINGLTPNTQYFYAVRQQCDSANTSLWVEGTFTTAELPCFAPDSLQVVSTSYSTAELTWQSTGSATTWVLAINGQGNLNRLDTVSTNPYTITGLYADAQYTVAARAICLLGTVESDWSDTLTFTTAACTPVTGVTVSNITASTAMVNWNAIPGASTYRVSYGESGFYESEALRAEVTTNSYT